VVETDEAMDAAEAAEDRSQRRNAILISAAALAVVLLGSVLVVLPHV